MNISWLGIANVSRLCPLISINQLSWRPPAGTVSMNQVNGDQHGDMTRQLAVAGGDSSLRIFSIRSLPEK